MKKERTSTLQQIPGLKENPFKTPEGYFADMAERLKQEREKEGLIREEKPVRRLDSSRRWIAMAAALAVLALVSYPLIRVISPSSEMQSLEELALLERSGLYYNDYILVAQLEDGALDDEEAFATLAENYLTGSTGAIDLYLEIE